uniref:Hypothetical secreted protein 2005 n=1 Tax=Amblyomma variegatum TaxID=34610 RepID=F0JA06_AMBVA|nr:TPA_inf: hypothetical secreted protein 2005 [Amblyomma variegatum]
MSVCANVLLLLFVFLLSVCLPWLFDCLFLYTYAFYYTFTREMNTCHPRPHSFIHFTKTKVEGREKKKRLPEKSTKKIQNTFNDEKHRRQPNIC